MRDQYGQNWAFPYLTDSSGSQGADDSVWLIFLPGVFTPVCMTELEWVNKLAHDLAGKNVGVRVVGVEPVPVMRYVADNLGLEVPVLSDFWPHGGCAQHFNAFDKTTGKPLRHSVFVNAQGDVLNRIEATANSTRTREQHHVLHF